MATNTVEEAPGQLKYKTWALKVSIHCEGCSKKVKKVLQDIEGVYKVEIDSQQHKATVTGNVEAETLLKKLLKSGKHADLWPENPTNKSKKKKKKKKNKPSNNNDDDDDEQDGEKAPEGAEGSDHDGEESPKEQEEEEDEDDEAAGEASAATGGKKKKKKKKKNKGQNDNVSAPILNSGNAPLDKVPNMLPNPEVYPYELQMYYPNEPAAYGLSYNTAYPSAMTSYYTTPMYGHYDSNYWYHPLPPPSDRVYLARDRDHFYYHDEYEGGCFIM